MPRPRTVPTPDRRITAGTLRNREGQIPVKAYRTKTGALGLGNLPPWNFEKIILSANPLKVERELFEEAADRAGVRAGEIQAVYVPKKLYSKICVVRASVGRDTRFLKINNTDHFYAIFNKAKEARKERKKRKRL